MAYNPQIHHRRSIRLNGYDYSQAGLYFVTICCEKRLCRFGEIVGAGFTPALDGIGQPQIGQPQGFAPTDAQMILNEFGTVSYNEWSKLPERFPNFVLDVFQIMPNHMHGIIMLNDGDAGAGFTPAQNDAVAQNDTTDKTVEAGFTPVLDGIGQPQIGQAQGLPLPNADDDNRATARIAPKIGDIVGAYKSLVANTCLEIYKTKNETMGKLWQRNYYEHIIRNEQSYQTISDYIINNPAKWKDDKFYME